MKTTLLVSVLSAASSVMAHGYVQEFLIGGTRYTGSLPFNDKYRTPAPDRITQPFWENGNSFVDDVTSTDITCNKGAKPAKLVAPAQAGSEVTFFWTEWPESHKGPVITWLADCGGDCTTAVGPTLNWFKIDEAGFFPEDKTWAATRLIANNNTWTVTLPKKIKNGQYLLRHEIIAHHASHEVKGAQFYPSCTNIEITGATGENNPPTVKIPGAYDAQDPSIFINIYYPEVKSYKVPGPAVYTEDGTSSPAPVDPPVNNPAPTNTFSTISISSTDGIFPTDGGSYGTGAPVPVPTEIPVPPEYAPTNAPAELTTKTVVTTIVTTIGGQPITLTATYTTECTCTDEPTAAPEPTNPPTEPEACAEKTVTVTVTAEPVQVPASQEPEFVTTSITNTQTDYVTITRRPGGRPTNGPVRPKATKTKPTKTQPTQDSSSISPETTEIPIPDIYVPPPFVHPDSTTFVDPAPTATDIYVPPPFVHPTSVQPSEPSGTGAPLTGYEGALTRRDCEDAYAKCKRTFDGCMKRAKRSGMQARSCEMFKRDICVLGLTGCDERVRSYKL